MTIARPQHAQNCLLVRLPDERPRGGSILLLLTPRELVARIATLVAPPRVHGVRYHGLFAPHSKERSRVVPVATPQPAVPERSVASDPAKSHSQPAQKALRTYRIPWALLLRKVFALDVLRCPVCGGGMKVMAVIADTAVARRILDHLGLDSTGPPIAAHAQGPPELLEPGPDYDASDHVYPD